LIRLGARRSVDKKMADRRVWDLRGSGAQLMSMTREEAITPAPSDLADTVRTFYDAHPYPAPLTTLEGHRDLYKNPDRSRAMFHLMWPTEQRRANLEILVAGCGTSQAASYALREPDARITAIDISDTSLRHTRDLQHKYNLNNLEVYQLPIESVREIGRSFDLVVCTGVLHHLPDPDYGLCALRDVLRPSGAMRLMVYARYGRAGIYMMQEYCRLLGIGASATDLQDLGATLEALSADHPISRVLRRTTDFRRPEALVDALLHPRDRAYTVPELYAWLDRCGISFGRWIEQGPYLARCGSVARSLHAARLALLPSRLQHAAVELFRGTMDKHAFVAYRDDRSNESQPITFEFDSWRGYVPLRLPWTRCIWDRAPPGFAAVLINPAHIHPDLALPIDAAQAQVLAAIDGNRSVDEILRGTARAIGEEQGRLFIKRLWEYDQIVFDAKGSSEC
jgi:SAM-dependent methyltransferase